MDIDLDKVPLRQSDMQPFEILLSESQERMLVVVKKGDEAVVEGIFDKWDLHAECIGTVTEGNQIRFYKEGDLVAEVPADTLVLGGGAPVYDREFSEPAWYADAPAWDASSVPVPSIEEAKDIADRLIQSPNIASKKWVWEQYDSMVGTINRSTNRPSDAGVVSVREQALALTVDCNARYVEMDPEIGTAIAVAEAARNISCSGGVPSAITNCLNFGNPYNPEVYWQFVKAIEGMGRSCRHFITPVTGGNVSFYNQSAQPDGSAVAVSRPRPSAWSVSSRTAPTTCRSISKRRENSSSCSAKSPTASTLRNTSHAGVDRSPTSLQSGSGGQGARLRAEGHRTGLHSRRPRRGRWRLVCEPAGDGHAEWPWVRRSNGR